MSYSPDNAYLKLERANPAPLSTVERPSAEEFLAAITEEAPFLSTAPRPPRRGPLVAVAAFVVVLLVGLVAVLLVSAEEQVVDEQTTTTSLPQTTSTLPTTQPSEAISVAFGLASAYSSGDFSELESLLADGTSYSWSRSSDFVSGPIVWTREEFAARFDIDVALNTTIELENCQELSETRVSCAILRYDDLVRAQQVEPSPDVRWRLTVEDGLVVEWLHFTPDISAYFEMAREPFHRWLDVAHPELEAPYSDLRGQPWRRDTDFASLAPDLVAEYADSLGVDLGR